MKNTSPNRINTGMIGIITRMKAECTSDEKVVIRDGIPVITTKNAIDRIFDRLEERMKR